MLEDFPREIKTAKQPIEDKVSIKPTNKKRSIEHSDEIVEKAKSKKLKLENHFKPFQFHVEQDTLVLGCVSEIRDYEVIVSLIDGAKGKISITDVGDDYTIKLQRLASGKLDDDGVKLLSLHDVFHLGSVVRCCVTQLEHVSKKKNISLTLNPRLVNRDVTKLNQGNLITGVVSSCEDHGYIIDIGVKSITAFLPKEETIRFIEMNEEHFADNTNISVGSYLTCLVENKKFQNKSEGGDRSITVTLDQDKISNSFQSKISLQSLLPGTPVKCSVTSKENNCLLVKVNSFEGIIFQNHLTKNLNHYDIDQELLVTVLFVQPSTKFIVLSQLKHLANPNKYEVLFDNFEIGNILPDIKISKVDQKFGLFFKLSDTVNGLVKKSQLSDKETISLNDFKKGQQVTCRVTGFNYLENIVHLTMRESIIKMAYFNYEDIKPGQVVECTIKMFYKGALIVKVMGRISGCIPAMHLSDIPLINPEKKFKVGKILKCKVLYINSDETKLILTNKKTLVKSKYPVPVNFEQIKLNSLITGFVVSIKPQGLLVVFCENVKGWVPRQELSYVDVSDDFVDQFYIGQVVHCKVLSCDSIAKKMVLSLKINKPEDSVETNENNIEAVSISKTSKPNAEIKIDKINDVEDKTSMKVPEKPENKPCKKKTTDSTTSKHLVLSIDEEFNWDDEMPENNIDQEIGQDSKKSEIISKARRKDFSSNDKRLELERGTLMEPNSSLVWLNLLAFEIENGEIDKAREVGEKALKTISYREDKEKLNIWMACINMEYQYGNDETLKETIDSALKCCDQYKVYCHVRDIYTSDQKIDKAVDICKILIKKYKTNPEVWVSYGQALYKAQRLQQARLVLSDSLERLDKQFHIELTTKFALLEAKYGVPERAETLLEDIVKNFPKRTDIWSIYIDICIKQDRIEQARNLFHRCTQLSLPAKKMKFLFKKFLNFEEKYGTAESVEEVKEKSSKYE